MFSLKWKFSVCFFQHDFYTYWTFCSQGGSRLSDCVGKGVKADWGLLGRDKRHRTLGISPSLRLPVRRLPLQRDLCLPGWASLDLIVGGGKKWTFFHGILAALTTGSKREQPFSTKDSGNRRSTDTFWRWKLNVWLHRKHRRRQRRKPRTPSSVELDLLEFNFSKPVFSHGWLLNQYVCSSTWVCSGRWNMLDGWHHAGLLLGSDGQDFEE